MKRSGDFDIPLLKIGKKDEIPKYQIEEEANRWLTIFKEIRPDIREINSKKTIKEQMPPNWKLTPRHWEAIAYYGRDFGLLFENSIFVDVYYGRRIWGFDEGLGRRKIIQLNSSEYAGKIDKVAPTLSKYSMEILDYFCFPNDDILFKQFMFDCSETNMFIIAESLEYVDFKLPLNISSDLISAPTMITNLNELDRFQLISFYYLILGFESSEKSLVLSTQEKEKNVNYVKNRIELIPKGYKNILCSWFICYCFNTGNQEILKKSEQIFDLESILYGIEYYFLTPEFRTYIDSFNYDASSTELQSLLEKTLLESIPFKEIVSFILLSNLKSIYTGFSKKSKTTEENKIRANVYQFIERMDFYFLGTFSMILFKNYLKYEELSAITDFKNYSKQNFKVIFSLYDPDYDEDDEDEPPVYLWIPSYMNQSVFDNLYKVVFENLSKYQAEVYDRFKNSLLYDLKITKNSSLSSKRFLPQIGIKKTWSDSWTPSVAVLYQLKDDKKKDDPGFVFDQIFWKLEDVKRICLNTIKIHSSDGLEYMRSSHEIPIHDLQMFKQFCLSWKIVQNYVIEHLVIEKTTIIDEKNEMDRDKKFYLCITALYCVISKTSLNHREYNLRYIGEFLNFQFKKDLQMKIRVLEWYYQYLYFYVFKEGSSISSDLNLYLKEAFIFQYGRVPQQHLLMALSSLILPIEFQNEIINYCEWGTEKNLIFNENINDNYIYILLQMVVKLDIIFDKCEFLFEMDCWFNGTFTANYYISRRIGFFVNEYIPFLLQQISLPNFHIPPKHLEKIPFNLVINTILENLSKCFDEDEEIFIYLKRILKDREPKDDQRIIEDDNDEERIIEDE